jgi:alpha-1,2-glucosyltransferase
MLYLWPYVLFFSHPIAIRTVAATILGLSNSSSIVLLRRLGWLIVFTMVAGVGIHFNTIVHPFTLADNRHYVFYVFRLLRLHSAIKYVVAPVYIVSAWTVIQTLGVARIRPRAQSALKARREEKGLLQGCSVSLVLAWLATTTLSLITAPLVEPRYCILPWIFWRLYIPEPTAGEALREQTAMKNKQKQHGAISWIIERELDIRLWLETAFFLLVNGVTGYVFLSKGFEWGQEPGKVQRFMW